MVTQSTTERPPLSIRELRMPGLKHPWALLVLLAGCTEQATDAKAEAASSPPSSPGEHPNRRWCTATEQYTNIGGDKVYTETTEYDAEERVVSYTDEAYDYYYAKDYVYDPVGCPVAYSDSLESDIFNYTSELSFTCDDHGYGATGEGTLSSDYYGDVWRTADALYSASTTYEGDRLLTLSFAYTYADPFEDWSTQGGYVYTYEDATHTSLSSYEDYDRLHLYSTETWETDEAGLMDVYTIAYSDTGASETWDYTRDAWGRSLSVADSWSTGLEVNYETEWAEDAYRRLSRTEDLGADGEVDVQFTYTWNDTTWPWSYRIEQDGSLATYTDGVAEIEAALDGEVDAWSEISWSCP